MTSPTDIHLELHVRTHPPEPIAARLDALRSELECLADARDWTLGVTHWPSKIELNGGASTDSAATFVHAAFDAWATEAGVSLAPAFERRNCYSWTNGDPCEALIFPVACLAVARDGDLEAVYPHRDGDEVYTIPDAVERLRADGIVTVDHEHSRPELAP